MTEDIKILCVDDEKNVLKSLRRLFIDEDYEILTAPGGKEGLEILQDDRDIQLIISDYRMPEMDGVEFLRKAFELNPETIRIVLSGYADTASVVAAINEGQIYKFIPKPWNDDELRVNITKALEVYFLQRKNEKMAEELMAMNEELRRINESLEDQVESRTADLIFQNRAMSFSHNVVDSLPVAVIGLDMAGLIVMSNRSADKLFDGSSAPLVGGSADKLLPKGLNLILDKVKESGLNEGNIELSGELYRVKGDKFLSDQGQEGLVLLLDSV